MHDLLSLRPIYNDNSIKCMHPKRFKFGQTEKTNKQKNMMFV